LSIFVSLAPHTPILLSFPTRRSSDLLPDSAFKASDLLLLLQMPEIMEKFHFEENDLSLIHFWIHDANIKQAIDGQHLTDELQTPDRKSTRLNSSHVSISYAVFCLKKK